MNGLQMLGKTSWGNISTPPSWEFYELGFCEELPTKTFQVSRGEGQVLTRSEIYHKLPRGEEKSSHGNLDMR